MKKVVLIVEDEDLVARMYERSLGGEDFEVVVALSGSDGLKKAFELKPDLILMDIMMPGLNGIDAIVKLRENPLTKDTPIIVLSNLSGKHDVEIAKEKGADDYWIKKDVPPSNILKRVRALLKDKEE